MSPAIYFLFYFLSFSDWVVSYLFELPVLSRNTLTDLNHTWFDALLFLMFLLFILTFELNPVWFLFFIFQKSQAFLWGNTYKKCRTRLWDYSVRRILREKKNDGFYFSLKTTIENVQLAANLASRATGLPPFELKCQTLKQNGIEISAFLREYRPLTSPQRREESRMELR